MALPGPRGGGRGRGSRWGADLCPSGAVCKYVVHDRCAMKALPCEVSTYAKSRKDIGVSGPVPAQSSPDPGPGSRPIATLTFPSAGLRPSRTRGRLSPQGPVTRVGARRL